MSMRVKIGFTVLALAIAAGVVCAVAHYHRLHVEATRKAQFAALGVDGDGTTDLVPLPPFAPRASGYAMAGAGLFCAPKLSGAKTTSCATCHPANLGGADGLKHDGVVTRPTFGAAFARRLFRDGSATSLAEAVSTMLFDARYMNAGRGPALVNRLLRDRRRAGEWRTILADAGGLNVSNVVVALAEHIKGQVAADRPVDRYLRGESSALSDEAKRGLALFRDRACMRCHAGPGLGEWHPVRDGVNVSRLRGIALRPVYGSEATTNLAEVVRRMPKRPTRDEDVRALVAFLNGL